MRHTFTHFALLARVLAAEAPPGAVPDRGAFAPLDPTHLPTLMRRAHALAEAALEG